MAYIGTKPTIGNFQICDAISVVNGQAAYTMQVGSVNVIPQSANHMIVSLNGTIQKPNSSFTVSGSTITFSSNLATGDVIDFIQILGDVLDLGVPSDATVTTAKLASDSVTYEKIGYNANQFRNIIINGDMSIAQRGTSTSGITSNGYYTADRMNIINEGIGTFTVSQSTDVPSGQGFAKSMKWDCTTANASPSSGFLGLRQNIEGQNLQYLKKGTSNAESLTLSFWIKSNKTGTYIVELFDEDNNRTIAQSYTISSSNTWEKKTLTFVGDTSGAFGNDNGRSLRVNLLFGAGTEYTSGSLQTAWGSRSNTRRAVGQVNLADSTSNELYITGVQLEAGTSASDFEFLPVDINKRRCQRYYQQIVQNSYFAGARANNTSGVWGIKLFTVTPLRAAPTIDAGTYQYYYGDAGNGAISNSVTATSVVTDDTGVTSRADSGFTGLEDNEPVIPVANSTIGYDSEL